MSEKKTLEQEVAELRAKLAETETKLTESESNVVAMQMATNLLGGDSKEEATGKTIKVNTCVNPWEKDTKKQKFKDFDVPTYRFLINLPVNATHLSTNGIDYYHGQSYEFTLSELAEMKSRVARCWDHERSINGANENAYRKQQHARVG